MWLSVPYVSPDEAWTLLVTDRTLRGDVLYRDVFFGSTPLSIWVLAWVARLAGTEALVLRTLLAACCAASILVAQAICRRFSAGKRAGLLLAVTILSLGDGFVGSLYTPLAVLLLLSAFLASLAWVGRAEDGASPTRRASLLLLAAGALAGLSFVTKPNIGLLALAAAVAPAGLVARGRGSSLRTVLVPLGGGFLAPPLLVAPWLWVEGGLPAFLDQVIVNKVTYVCVGGVSYAATVEDVLKRFGALPGVSRLPHLVHDSLRVSLPALALLLTAIACFRPPVGRRRDALAVAALCTAGILSFAPRYDMTHLAQAAPLLTTTCWCAAALALRERSPVLRPAATALGLLLAVEVVSHRAIPFAGLMRDTWTPIPLPHVRGILIPSSSLPKLLAGVEAIRSAAGPTGTLLIVAPEASYYYLLSGVRNPTPFDYPLVTAFGRSGEERVARDVASGRVARVCFRPMGSYVLSPVQLERAIGQAMVPGADLGPCRLHFARQ